MRLSDDELKAVLARAEEIERTRRQGDAWHSEVNAVVVAGQEIGLSREAMEQALAERVGMPVAPPAPGAMVWARSTDGQYYVAEVLSASEREVRVRYLRGGEHTVPLDGMRAAGFLPGEKVMVDWPMWGPAECSVVSWDSPRQRLKVADSWGLVKTFPVAEVWRRPERSPVTSAGTRGMGWIIAASGTVGALIGGTLMALLLR